MHPPTPPIYQPTSSDVPQIQELVNSDPEHLIPRTRQEIRRKLKFWRIVRFNGRVVGCGCMDRYSRRMAEVRSLIVHVDYRDRGYGRLLLRELLSLASPGQQVFVVTSLPDFFKAHAFAQCLEERYILFHSA